MRVSTADSPVDGKHKCPAPVCNRQVPYERLACRNHWYAIPKPLRDQIWDAYLSAAPEHTALIAEAIQYLHEHYPDSRRHESPL